MIDTSENEVTTKGTFLCARKLNKKKKKASFRSSYGKGDHLFNSVTPWCSVQTDSSDPPPPPPPPPAPLQAAALPPSPLSERSCGAGRESNSVSFSPPVFLLQKKRRRS